jgi:tyrosyl-tRNA synthetase
MTTTTTAPLLEELSWRGLIHDSTDPAALREHLTSGRRRFYIGFDPSADSLTIGNLLPITLIMRGARAGLGAVVLLGGGTGLIGDPSGKSQERALLAEADARANVASHAALMRAIFERGLAPEQLPAFIDNHDWLGPMPMLEFLREVGKHFPLTELLRRDAVRRRLDDPEQGITYTEFSYALLQAYDFLRLRADHGVTLQLGASDQWGNIVAGIDYIRRVLREQVHGLTCPLLLRPDGSKYGKTERGAVWLSADRTSPYALYQFLLNLTDEEAPRFARFFSLEPRERLERLLAEHTERPALRRLQRHLAAELTTLLHGAAACERAEQASEALFSGDVRAIGDDLLGEVFADVPTVELAAADLDGPGLPVVDLLVAVQLAASRREAREHLANGAVLVNGDKPDPAGAVTAADRLHGAVILVRRGKREWRVARFT